MLRPPLLVTALVLWAGGASAQEEPERARARLITEREALVPGRTQQVGVEIDMDRGWHVYWLNSGDTGVPTTVEVLDPPRGLTVGPASWPAPKAYAHEGLLDYIYEDRVTILLPVTVGKTVKPGSSLQIKVRVGWLVCKEVCLPGEVELSLSLKIAAAPGKQTRDAPQFAATRRRLPTPLPRDVQARWRGLELQLSAPRAKALRFYPLLPADHAPDGKLASAGSRLAVPYPKGVRAAKRVKGLLELRRGKRTHWHWIDVPVPRAKTP